MNDLLIQQIWKHSYSDFLDSGHSISWEQQKTSDAIIKCKSGSLGYNLSECTECGFKVIHANSCRNRNCPNCQAVKKELWVDKIFGK